MVIVVVIGAIGLWELIKGTWTSRVGRLASLRAQARLVMDAEPLSRVELREFQDLLTRDPGTLSILEAERFLELRTRFSSRRSARSSRPSAV